jgi:hypothetical protein
MFKIFFHFFFFLFHCINILFKLLLPINHINNLILFLLHYFTQIIIMHIQHLYLLCIFVFYPYSIRTLIIRIRALYDTCKHSMTYTNLLLILIDFILCIHQLRLNIRRNLLLIIKFLLHLI